MPLAIKTERLLLRPLRPEDFGFMRALHGDTRVMKYIGSEPTRTEAQTREGLSKALALAKTDPLLGAWVAELADSGVPIGSLILRKPATSEKTEGLEIGYSFVPSQWRKGYATEAARGIIDYVFGHFGCIRIVALIHPDNDASRGTLTKLGFKSAGRSSFVDPATGSVLPTEIMELVPPAP